MVDKSLLYCSLLASSYWDSSHKVRRQASNTLTMEPTVCPKNSSSAVSNLRINGCCEKSSNLFGHMYVEVRPWTIGLCFLQPNPTHLQWPSQCLKVWNSESTKFFGPANCEPSDHAMAPVCFPAVSPKESSPNFVYRFDCSCWKLNSHEEVNEHSSKHKLYLDPSPCLSH